jgi:hypothetical protein
MNRIEKNNPRSVKREKLKSFLSERRSQKEAQAVARKEAVRRLAAERRARLVSEGVQARQRKEALKEIKVKSQIKINAVKPDKTASLPGRPPSEKRKVFTGGKAQPDFGEKEVEPSFLAPAANQQAKNRQKLLSYLEKHRVKKAEIIAGKIRRKEAAAGEKQARRAELKKQEQPHPQPQPKPIIPAQKKAGETVSAVIGQPYKRQQLLAYLKKRKAGEKSFAVQRRNLKKITAAVTPEAVLTPAASPEAIPVIIPLVTPPPSAPSEIAAAVPEKVSAPAAETLASAAEEKPTGRRLKLPSARGKKSPADAALTDSPVPVRNPFRVVPFLKDNFGKILVLLLILGWFAEVFMLKKHLDSVSQQLEQSASIARPKISTEAVTTAKASPPVLGTAQVEGIRDPFSNELWRIQEITPASVRVIANRPSARIPLPSPIIRGITPILIPKPPEFTPPEVGKAIPESAKLARIPQVTVPQTASVSAPTAPVFGLRFRGILNVAGIDYFFIEGANGGYRVRIGDVVEGFKIYDFRNGVLYFAKDGYTYQLNEERVSPPLHYRGRMIMAGQEYFFLEGQRTYRAVIGEAIEGYQLVKRVGDYLYFVKDDRLYYLKQE